MTTIRDLRSLTSSLSYRLTGILLALGLAGCAGMGGGTPNPVVGTWTTQISTPQGEIAQTITFNADMSGTVSITLPEPRNIPFTYESVDGQSISFDLVVEIQFQDTTFKFTGNVDGDVITGQYDSDLGTVMVTGTRI